MQPKYNVGDKVWIKSDGEAKEFEVYGVIKLVVNAPEADPSHVVKYWVSPIEIVPGYGWINEADVFATQEEA